MVEKGERTGIWGLKEKGVCDEDVASVCGGRERQCGESKREQKHKRIFWWQLNQREFIFDGQAPI